MRKSLTISGTVLGVDFSVQVVEATQDQVAVVGTVGGVPATLDVKVGDDSFRVSGTLLGKPIDIATS